MKRVCGVSGPRNKATLGRRGKKKVVVGGREEERRRSDESSRPAGGSGVFQQWQGRQDVRMDAGAWATSTDIEEPRLGGLLWRRAKATMSCKCSVACTNRLARQLLL
jgi:hypothetical protein